MGEIRLKMFDKSSEKSTYRQGKRRLTSKEEVERDLKEYFVKLFNTLKIAMNMFNEKYAHIPNNERIRGYEANSFNQCLVSSAFKAFRRECSFGKHRVFFLRLNGYKMLFKKLGNNGKPMNIKTVNVSNIINQRQLDIFGDSECVEPILYFGYKKDRLGNFVDPQIVYIDEGVIKFVLNETDVENLLFQEVNEGYKDIEVIENKVKLKQIKKIINN